MNTRVISKETEGKLLSVSTSLTQDLRNDKDKSALLSKMKEAEHLFGLAMGLLLRNEKYRKERRRPPHHQGDKFNK